MEGFAFQYLEIKFGKYGKKKNCAKKKSGNLDKTSFDKNGPKWREAAGYAGRDFLPCHRDSAGSNKQTHLAK